MGLKKGTMDMKPGETKTAYFRRVGYESLPCAGKLAAVRDYCGLNAFKWRAKEKDSVESNTRKALWFLRMSVGDDPRQERGRGC